MKPSWSMGYCVVTDDLARQQRLMIVNHVVQSKYSSEVPICSIEGFICGVRYPGSSSPDRLDRPVAQAKGNVNQLVSLPTTIVVDNASARHRCAGAEGIVRLTASSRSLFMVIA